VKIFLATSEVPPAKNGMARVTEKLSAGFRSRGHSVDIVAGAHLPRLLLADIRLAPLLPHWGWVHERAAQADVVSLHGPVPAISDFFLLMNRLQGGLPPIAYMHHMDIRFRRGTQLVELYGSLYANLAARAELSIVSTEATRRSISHPAWRARTHVVPFGVEQGCVAELPREREFTLLFVGQLRPYKGVDVLLRAMRRLKGVRLRIVGKGYAEQTYRDMAGRFGLDNVEFLGGVSDEELWRLYATSHLFVLPSMEMEYFGLVLLEAMISGGVPVTSDMPGPAEVVGDAGRIVPRGDDLALAEAIAALRDSPATVAELSDRARARAATFTWDRCVERHLELYSTISRSP
jgi:rhamnosyl/mannosyltransferase